MCTNMKAKVLSELQTLQEDGEDLGEKLKEVLPTMERRSVSVRKNLSLLGGSCVDWRKIQRAKESKWAQWADASQVESKFQSFPRDHFVLSAPLATHRGPKVLGDPLCYEPTLRAGGSETEVSGTWCHLWVWLSCHRS